MVCYVRRSTHISVQRTRRSGGGIFMSFSLIDQVQEAYRLESRKAINALTAQHLQLLVKTVDRYLGRVVTLEELAGVKLDFLAACRRHDYQLPRFAVLLSHGEQLISEQELVLRLKEILRNPDEAMESFGLTEYELLKGTDFGMNEMTHVLYESGHLAFGDLIKRQPSIFFVAS